MMNPDGLIRSISKKRSLPRNAVKQLVVFFVRAAQPFQEQKVDGTPDLANDFWVKRNIERVDHIGVSPHELHPRASNAHPLPVDLAPRRQGGHRLRKVVVRHSSILPGVAALF
ncbi:MAG: hypothetical protein MUF54_06950 [Polyangiaceae bacterium]|nr:hypothetical protein [Polyangiaceae bacterium]